MKDEKLLVLLQKKKGFFETILELCHEEVHLPVHKWTSVLEQKKILLACIEEIDEEIALFKDSFHELSQEITDELDEIRKMIEKILHLDTHTTEKRKHILAPHERRKT